MKTQFSAIEKKTIAINTLFNFGGVLAGLFVSVYLYVYTRSIPVMCLRAGFWMLAVFFFYPVAYKVSRRTSVAFTYTLGLSLITASLVFLLAAGSLVAEYPLLVMIQAVIYGAGDALYYYSAGICNQIVPTGESRNAFLSWSAFLATMAAIFAPVISTAILSFSTSELAGYRIILAVLSAVFLAVSLIAFSVKIKAEDTGDRLKEAYRLCKTDPRLKRLGASYLSFGFVNGLGLCLMGLLVFRAAGSGSTYSSIQIVFSLIAASGYYLVKYFIQWGKLKITFRLGAAVRMASIIILVVLPNLTGAILHGVLLNISYSLFDHIISYITAVVLDDYPGMQSALIVVKERMHTLGRIGSMAVVLVSYLLFPGDIYLTVTPVLLALFAVVTAHIMIKCLKK